MRKLSILLIASFLLVACAPAANVTTDTILAAWKTGGLQAENPQPMTKDDYGMAPYVCEGMRFFIPSLGEDKGGRLFICSNKEDRDLLTKYYTEMGRQSAMLFSWVFVKGDFVVQINGNLDETTAHQYEAVLNATVP